MFPFSFVWQNYNGQIKKRINYCNYYYYYIIIIFIFTFQLPNVI